MLVSLPATFPVQTGPARPDAWLQTSKATPGGDSAGAFISSESLARGLGGQLILLTYYGINHFNPLEPGSHPKLLFNQYLC